MLETEVEVLLDENLVDSSVYSKIVQSLDDQKYKHKTIKQLHRNSISFLNLTDKDSPSSFGPLIFIKFHKDTHLDWNEFRGMAGRSISIIFCGKLNDFKSKHSNIQHEVMDLKMMHGINIHFMDSISKIGDLIKAYTKSLVASNEKKYNAELFNKLGFCMTRDMVGTVNVSEKNGLKLLWQQQLTRIPQVSLEVAEAIIETYPSLRILLDKYAEDKENAELLLSDIPLKKVRGTNKTKDRRIGAAISKKIYRLYASKDSNVTV